MRVLFVTGEYPPMQGGVGDYTWSLGTALARQNVDVHVLTGQEAGPSHLAPQGVANVYPEVSRWNWRMIRQVRASADEVKPDVLHIQYQSAAFRLHPAINLLPRSMRHRRWPLRVAVTFHDLRVPYLFPKAGPLRWQINLEPARCSDIVIVTNAEDKARLLDYPELADKLFEIPIGANILSEPPADFDREQQRARWGVRRDDFLLCYFGFLNASKGGEELIAGLALAVNQGMPAKLLMIGGQVGASDPTNAAYLQRVKTLIAELGLEGRVHWTGFLPASQVSASFLAADVAVLPYRDGVSFRRGSLMAALEHSLPIISTEPATPIPELRHGQNIWLVPPSSAADLAAAIQTLWLDGDSCQQLREGAKQLATAFTWEAIAQRHLEVYRESTR